MKIFAIGDLHLAHQVHKPMNVFGDNWKNHMIRLKANWEQRVSEEDIVIVCGDISWGMRFHEAYEDLSFLDQLPGKKICIRGNHDYWWAKISDLNKQFEKIYFLQNTSYSINDLAICGTRGWMCPLEKEQTKEDEKIYLREGQRLKLSLQDGMKKGAKRFLVALHYPPTNGLDKHSLFTDILKSYNVEKVVYGHLHDTKAWDMCLKGIHEEIDYKLVAADYLGFTPELILELEA